PGDQELAVIPGSEGRGLVLPLQGEFEHLDPEKVGWETEVFGETAKLRLKEVVAGLSKPGPITAGSIGGVVAAGFRGSVLRPELEEVFRDGSLAVWRTKKGADGGVKTVEG
ncbi:MAG: hypothetical protein GWO24_18765, partial [Akkermansiaceae bacterium]|nr:hypothetical protein [Akkermansiaceae bacterium]